jgi:hypothetical protein
MDFQYIIIICVIMLLIYYILIIRIVHSYDLEKQRAKQISEFDARSSAIAKTKRIPSCRGFDQVAGLEDAKQLLQEALILPSQYPQLFKGNH